ncbi:hypothetical protein QE152_g15499 [Popillia japonica]|uniref:Tyr recombinase domain-containing protein n=1 Tax=Popillia japonica TaxID=7064 RepID=A0AAW1L5F0_POPJA
MGNLAHRNKVFKTSCVAEETDQLERLDYKPKKTKTLDRNDLTKFLMGASDEMYLCTKIVAIMGLSGECRMDELHKMTIDDIEDNDPVLIVKLPNTKTKNVSLRNLLLRSVPHKEFFSCYRALKSAENDSTIVESENIHGTLFPTYLRTATLVAEAGADLLQLKYHKGWKSSTKAEA